MPMPEAQVKAQATSISKWVWARKGYIDEQRRKGKMVSPVKPCPVSVIKRNICEILQLQQKQALNVVSQKDINHFHRKYIRSKMTRPAKKSTMKDLLSKPLNPYDLAMALEVSAEDTIDALSELEGEGKITPLGDSLRPALLHTAHVELNLTA